VALPGSLGQGPEALDQTITIAWNDVPAFQRALTEHGREIAAVIMEPIMLNAGAIEPLPGYLQAVREACTRLGIVLIFDETISGFRLGLDGAAGKFGVDPDLAVYGKAMAAGWPCAALVGRRDLFDGVASGAVTHAGTFNGNTIATAAVLASLDELQDGSVYRRIETVGGTLMGALRGLILDNDLPMQIQGLPMAFHMRFDESAEPITTYERAQSLDTKRYGEFARRLIDLGVWIAYRGIWYVSAAHSVLDVDETVERIAPAFSELRHS
jgi:glutamate-1-semialdehyde 2,1-aminomutase